MRLLAASVHACPFPPIALHHASGYLLEELVTAPVLVWFREDLRIADNPALSAAAATGSPVLCCYILDEESAEVRPRGGASRWWLHGSLAALNVELESLKAGLLLFTGAAREVLPSLIKESGCSQVFWNRRYGPERQIDVELKERLRDEGIAVTSFEGRLIQEPGRLTTKSGTPFKVFTPFHKAALRAERSSEPLPAPRSLPAAPVPARLLERTVALEALRLEPTKPDWAKEMRASWTRGEEGAHERLYTFLENGFQGYATMRNRPDLESTSLLSPSLHFGEITPRQVAHAARHAIDSGRSPASERDFESLRSELGWRDFSYELLFDNGEIVSTNINRAFDAFPWRDDAKGLAAWQRGRTGYPLVDAGMRQLWRTGFMHNRIRMVTASFLIKHLLIDWRHGEKWFWDTLVDADPANNAASWQWVAGSGADAAPYYRIFNPVMQGEKFDPNGDYVRRWVPEIAGLPSSVIHRPWEASASVLESSGVKLGETYPLPIVAHAEGRQRAMAAFERMKSESGPSA